MVMSSEFMGHTVFLLLLSLLLVPASTHLQSNDEGHVSVLLSSKGIDFAKDVLIDKAISSMLPLQLPDIEKSVKIPLIGKVKIVLSNITIYSVEIASSYVETGETGLVLVASGATADLSMNWKYSYSTWIVVISDHGDASVQVKGMDVGFTVALKEEGGTLKVYVLDCGCHVKDISITLNGGASWLYQGLIDAFEGPIGSAVENAISKKIKEGIGKLDTRLQSLPKHFAIDHTASMNITFVDNPVLSTSSIEFEINGLFAEVDTVSVPINYYEGTWAPLACKHPDKMIEISLHEDVFNSATSVYFSTGHMLWTVDKFVDQSLLNTASWKFIYPQLYTQYPDDNMTLTITITSAPIVKIEDVGINVTIYVDVTVNVLDAGDVIPVACVSLELSNGCSPQILSNKLASDLKLKNFNMSLKWSKIGNVHMQLLQPVMHDIIESVFIPYVNLHLMRGYALPILHGFTFKNPEIQYAEAEMGICSNLAVT
ncbi:hypothetical protein Tsubulata_023008 [Turnera subulata]|uniref:Lipid-binding serum glycoprotein C-terminal domain-containing protein n=1 Tax=Turnera subulata TaxID=218843 RepID=A0A9Q0F785_9ROSI|nr:hypothetical protein Tsubulata_023008 [Turnera subulata]